MRVLFLFCFTLLFSNSYSQCCCAYFKVTFVDANGAPIDNSTEKYKFKIKKWYSPVFGIRIRNVSLQDRNADGTGTNGSLAEKGIPISTDCGLKKIEIRVLTKKIRMKLIILNVPGDTMFTMSDVKLQSGKFKYQFYDILKLYEIEGKFKND